MIIYRKTAYTLYYPAPLNHPLHKYDFIPHPARFARSTRLRLLSFFLFCDKRPHVAHTHYPPRTRTIRFLFRRLFLVKCAYSGRQRTIPPVGHNPTTVFAARLDVIKHRVIYTVLLNRPILVFRPLWQLRTRGLGVSRVRPYKTVCDVVNIWKTHIVRP